MAGTRMNRQHYLLTKFWPNFCLIFLNPSHKLLQEYNNNFIETIYDECASFKDLNDLRQRSHSKNDWL